MNIPFNIPYLSGKEIVYLKEVIESQRKKEYSNFRARCKGFIEQKWGFNEVHLTASCTSALEIAAILTGIKPGDEVIVPSWTFPSTASAFIRQGARIILADSRADHPGIDEDKLEPLITGNTKAIVPVHYAGVSCDMDKIMKLASKHNLYVIEDAAHAIGGYFKDQPLGSIGHIGCFSFHRTKNIQCIEGGALILNDQKFSERAINIIEKGTDKQEFIRGNKEQYEWVDLGSSFGMSELHAAFLLSQFETSDLTGSKRKEIWDEYYKLLMPLHENGLIDLPGIPDFATHNSHMFYIVTKDKSQKSDIKSFLADHGIEATVHYIPLDRSQYWIKNGLPAKNIVNSHRFNDCILRLPLFNSMTLADAGFVVYGIKEFFGYKN